MTEFPQTKLGLFAVYIGRGITPVYTDDENEQVVLNQKCVRDGNLIDPKFARFHSATTTPVSNDMYLKPGDLLINALGSGTIGRSAVFRGSSTPVVCDSHIALVRLDPDRIDPIFASWILQTKRKELEDFSAGSTNQTFLTQSSISNSMIPLPDLETQRRIADYLDKETSEIDALIEEFEGLVNSLGVRKRLLIDSIFDQNVPRLALKFLADFVPGFAFPSTSFTDDPNCTFLFRGVNLKPGIIDPTDSLYFDGSIEVPERFVLREGDVVLGMDRPFIKSGVRVATIPQEFEGSYLVQRVLKIEGRTDAYTRLFTYALSSSRFIDHITPDFTGISVPHLSADQVGSFSVPLLSESEAQRVVDRLDSEFENTNFLIEESTKLIENLKARKTALITEVVTGRKEV